MSTIAVQTERLVACPLCGSRHGRPVYASRDRQHGRSAQRFVYSRCGQCRVIYQSLRPAENEIAAFYPDDYAPYQPAAVVRADPAAPPQGPHLKPNFRRRLHHWAISAAERLNDALRRRYPDPLPAIVDAVYAPPRRGATLLDFGCGTSDFLNRARERGWNTLAADFIAPVVDAVRRDGHEAYLCDASLWEAIPDGSLDLVRMNHVIEHLYEPRVTLGRLRRKLRPGGKLHLATPNSDSFAFRLLGTRWYPLDCPRHIVVYSPRSARWLLHKVGFARVGCFQEVLTKDTARSLGYVMHDLGWTDTAGALGQMHRKGLAGLLFAPARLSALVGGADRFHAFAEA